jgi:hypothetical protein
MRERAFYVNAENKQRDFMILFPAYGAV